MPRRVLAFFLALSMLWCALGTVESPQAFGSLLAYAAAAEQPSGSTDGSVAGSVEDHHLDDLPTQVTPDPASDPCLLPEPPTSPGLVKPGWLPSGVIAAPHGPCLPEPLRPPRRTAAA